MNFRRLAGLTALTVTLGLSACVVTPPHIAFTPPIIAVAPIAPPPPRVEVVPVAPGPDFVWIGGYWHYEGNEHRWIAGHYEQRRGNQEWVGHRWDRDERGQWQLHGGYWR